MTPTPSNCRTSCSTKGELKRLVDGRLSDDQTLAMAIHDGAVKRLERRRARVIVTIKAHSGLVWGMSIRHDGNLFRDNWP